MGRRSYVILWVALAILLLGALYFGLYASLGGRDASGQHSRIYRLSVSAVRPGEELPVFKATQGDTVTLLISSDRPGEAHVHGYEKKIVLEPGGDVALILIAETAGLYPVHLHERLNLHEPDGPILHRHLAALEVQPK